VAANALNAGVDINLSGSTSDRRYNGGSQSDVRFGDGTYSGGLDLDLPWNRREERNAYREALLGLDRARRALEQKEDEIKRAVREAIRNLQETAEAHAIQTKALQLAEKRVKSTAMFLESGRAQTRDLLDAQEALVNAQSALTDALVSYHAAYWNLLRDTGRLQVDAGGVWNLDYQNGMGEEKK
jgi:outer membrane protein TolC